MPNQLKIIYDSKSFVWTPPNANTDDDEWDNNFDQLIKEINNKYHLNSEEIELTAQDAEGDEMEIECGDDLLSLWQDLIKDDQNTVTEIKIIGDIQSQV